MQEPSNPGARPKPGARAPIPLDDAALAQVAGGSLLDPSQLSSMTPQQIQQLLGGTVQGG
jgi:hypothetical protein